MGRLENLLGAQAIALTDRLRHSGSAVGAAESAALVTLHAHPDTTVTRLGEILALTSSGVTRLVDRLAAAGWVTRTAGADRRSRRLRLTEAGTREARAVLEARAAAMAAVVGGLSDHDRAELERLLGLMITTMATSEIPAMRVCRLCDRAACADRDRECPLQHTVEVADA
ncbi:MAG TPA: MarR family transcriptional regulator [Microlunatus sp.]|nr:MarR family transcriptional regulator [Microlunatus sp.]